jgi:hypothetical protein
MAKASLSWRFKVLYRIKDGKTLVFIIKFSVDYTDNQIVLSGRTILYGPRLSRLGKNNEI